MSDASRHRRSAIAALLVAGLGLPSGVAGAQLLEYGPPFIHDGAFDVPVGVAVDPLNGRVLVVDAGAHRVRYTGLADLEATPTWSELGFVADRAVEQALNEPQGVAVDAAGHVYVVDTFGGEVELYRWDAAGTTYSYDAGFAGTTRNEVGGVPISFPRDIAVGPDGKVYLLDSGNSRVLVADGPDDTSWEVWKSNPAWGNPYGFDIAGDGAVILADTDHHQIRRVPATGPETAYGSYGRGDGQLRHPRDVAIGPTGRFFVADTGNHRVTILRPDGTPYRLLATPPLLSAPQKIEVDADSRVFVVDSAFKRLVAFLGPDAEPPFDAYLRDYVGDTGEQPSSTSYVLASPDILVRHAPDVDLAAAGTSGLESYAFQQPRYGESNYVYVAVHNRGVQPISGSVVRVYWAHPAGTLTFPDAWNTSGLYRSYSSETANVEAYSLLVGNVPARVGTVDGVTVVGPLIWRPPAPEDALTGDGDFYLLARVLNVADPSEPAPGLEEVRLNNNIAARRVTVTRGPFGVGDQDTLVVRVNFPDVAGEADLATVTARIDALAAWVGEVSYGGATVRPNYVDPIALDHPTTYYAEPTRNLLIELTTEVLEKVAAITPNPLDGATEDPADDIDRLILVVNDPAYTVDWATTGHWPYVVAGETRHLSVSVQGPGNTAAQYAHGFSHQLGLEDLYVYPNVDFPLDHTADRWDNMATPFEGAHPLTWSKEHATWVTATGRKVHYIHRPPQGSPILGQPPVELAYQATAGEDDIAAIVIGLTEGVTALTDEDHFYVVEARSPSLAGAPADGVVPADGVLVYYANELIPQGLGPVIVRDHVPSTTTIDDAVVHAPDSESPPGTGIVVAVESALPDDGGYLVRIDYDPPPTDYDVYVERGDPSYTSPDIWVDNQEVGGGYEAEVSPGTTLTPGDEMPIADQENRIYVRVHNTGPATAYNVEIHFRLSDPYHQVNGVGEFDLHAIRFIDELPPGEFRDRFFIWEPEGVEDPHTCVKVELYGIPNDNNAGNNWAQQNLHVQQSTTASPYEEVVFPFQVRNDKPVPQLVYPRAESVPSTWTRTMVPDKWLLAPGQVALGSLTVKPPIDAAVCTDHAIHVTGWEPRGDTLVRTGGAQVDVQLRNRTELTLETKLAGCRDKQVTSHVATLQPNIQGVGDVTGQGERCAVVTAAGCTQPPRPNETILVRYVDPSGNPVYREVTTDEHGCYQDFMVVVEGGDWEVEAIYPGDECSGRATTTAGVTVPLPSTGDQDNDGLPDDQEIQGDADGDGVPNQHDADADGDGVLDGQELDGDADRDGLDNRVDPDSDNDGVRDGDEPPGDADHDGTPNVNDPDSDGDGILDGEDPSPWGGLPGEVGCGCDPQTDRVVAWFLWLALLLALAALVVGWRRKERWLLVFALLWLVAIALLAWLWCGHAFDVIALIAALLALLVLALLVWWKRLQASGGASSA